MNPTTLGPKINGARHGMCDAGPIVMDDPGRNPALTIWARLTINGQPFTAWWGSREGDQYGWEWFAWIEIDGRQWLVTPAQDTCLARLGGRVQPQPPRAAA